MPHLHSTAALAFGVTATVSTRTQPTGELASVQRDERSVTFCLDIVRRLAEALDVKPRELERQRSEP